MKSLNLPYNPRIDQLRWLAAMLVFLFHFYLAYRGSGGAALGSSWFGLVSEGHTGVGLFFTLSGFLFMQIALHQRTIEYGHFVRNRLLRIFPLFLTIFLLATSIGRDKFQPQDILYLFTTNLGMSPTSGTVVTGAAWCISLEFLFYMVFPFLARFAMEQGPRYLLKLLALMLFFKLAAYTVNENSELMYFSTFVGRFDQFLIGMLAALLYQRHHARLQAYAIWLLPAAALLVFGNSAAQSHYARLRRCAQVGVLDILVDAGKRRLGLLHRRMAGARTLAVAGLAGANAQPRWQGQLLVLSLAHGLDPSAAAMVWPGLHRARRVAQCGHPAGPELRCHLGACHPEL